MIDDEMTAQIRFFFETLHEHFIAAAVELPVNVLRRLTGVVNTVFRKLHGKAMERTFVQTGNESFHYLSRQKLEVRELLKVVWFKRHRNKDKAISGGDSV
jgi:hypothetical protein